MPYGLTAKGESECRRCLKIKDEFEAARGGTPTTPIDSEDGEDQISEKFALESICAISWPRTRTGSKQACGYTQLLKTKASSFQLMTAALTYSPLIVAGVIVELVARGRSKALGQTPLLHGLG